MKSLGLTAIFCLIGTLLFAQRDFRPGYYISLTNDSIPVLVQYKTSKASSKKFVYKETKKGVIKSFSPGEIVAYGFLGGRRFITRTVKTEKIFKQKVFIEQIVSGKSMSLLHLGSDYYVEKDSLYRLVKTKDIPASNAATADVRTTRPYIGTMNYLVYDCQLKADEIKYGETGLSGLVSDYNKCKNSSVINYKAAVPATAIHWQLFTGVDKSKLMVDDLPKDAFKNSVSVVFGGSIDLSMPRRYDKILFSTEVLYTYKVYKSHEERDVPSAYDQKIDQTFKIKFLRIAPAIRINLFSENKTPYIKAGFSYYHMLHVNARIKYEDVNHQGNTMTNELPIDFKSHNQLGLWAAVGYSQLIKEAFGAFIEVRFEQGNGFQGYSDITKGSLTTNTSVAAGIRF